MSQPGAAATCSQNSTASFSVSPSASIAETGNAVEESSISSSQPESVFDCSAADALIVTIVPSRAARECVVEDDATIRTTQDRTALSMRRPQHSFC